MARDDPAHTRRAVLQGTRISLIGTVDKDMVVKLIDELASCPDESDVIVEITTSGGDADLARRMALEVRRARAERRGRLRFLGKTEVYSAGVTVMSAFPREDRYLTEDAILLVHSRQLETTVQLSGPIRSSLPVLDALRQQIDLGIKLEREGFESLIAGSCVRLEDLEEKALHDWYLGAEEALRLGLIAQLA